MNKKYIKIVFVDIDWTLYDHDAHKYDKKSIRALKSLQKKGIKVVIATARPYYSVKDFNLFKYITPDGLILSSGAIAIYNNELIYANYLDSKIMHKVVDIVRKYNLCIELVETYDRFYEGKKNDYVNNHHYIFKEIDGEEKEYKDQLINSALLFAPKEMDKILIKEFPKEVNYYRFSDYGVDIVLNPRDKGDTINKMLDYLHLSKDNAISFGDDIYDTSMLLATKYGVAMGNGKDELKKVSFEVTTPVSKHGIYHFLRKYKLVKHIF